MQTVVTEGWGKIFVKLFRHNRKFTLRNIYNSMFFYKKIVGAIYAIYLLCKICDRQGLFFSTTSIIKLGNREKNIILGLKNIKNTIS